MTSLHQAVYALYPNAIAIRGNDIESITAEDANNKSISISQNEVIAKLAELQAAEAQAEQAAKDDKDSALAKLAKLGLTEDEVKALLG
jgi:hypothetical protein